MKRLFNLFLFSALFACSARADGPTTGPASAGPLEVLGTNVVALGRILCYESTNITFRLVNRGDRSVSLTMLRPTCRCVKGGVDRQDVPTNGEVRVTLRLNPAGMHGPFRRGMWVHYSNPAPCMTLLSVTGEVIPLFEGAPMEPLLLSAPALGVTWTNRYTLTATDALVRLGVPDFVTNTALRVQFDLVTNAAPNASYDVALFATPLAPGKSLAIISLPVLGRPDQSPIYFNLKARVGLALASSPDKLALFTDGRSASRKLLLQTHETADTDEQITCDPLGEGVTVEIAPAKSKANFLVTATFTPEALQRLKRKRTPGLRFRYPRYEPVTVPFVWDASVTTEPEE